MPRSVRQPTMSDLDSSGSSEIPMLKLPDMHMQFNMPSSVVMNATSAMPIVMPTRDDEPLSTPPPLDMPEDAGCSYYASTINKPTISNSTGQANSGAFDLLNTGAAVEQVASGTTAEDGVTSSEQEKKPKKKRKRKSEQIEGEIPVTAEAAEIAIPAKRVRKKKPKKEAISDDVNGFNTSATESASMLLDTEIKMNSKFQSLLEPTNDSGQNDALPETADVETSDPVLIQHQDVEGDVPIIIVSTKAKKPKHPKTPKEHKEQKEPKEHKEPKEKKSKTLKEPKASREGKSSRGTKKKNQSHVNDSKILDTSDDRTVLDATDDGTDIAESQLEEELPTVEVSVEKTRPPPRPKLKKKRY